MVLSPVDLRGLRELTSDQSAVNIFDKEHESPMQGGLVYQQVSKVDVDAISNTILVYDESRVVWGELPGSTGLLRNLDT